jgi:hypothetical protein
LFKTLCNKKANLNSGTSGLHIYLCIKKDVTWKLPAVTNLVVVFPDKGEQVPVGYCAVPLNGQSGVCADEKGGCNLNIGNTAGTDRVLLCYKRGEGNPIIDIQLLLSSRRENVPDSFNVIEQSMTGISANLNSSVFSKGVQELYFSYRQRLNKVGSKNDSIIFLHPD